MKIGVVGAGAVGKRVLSQVQDAEYFSRDDPTEAFSDLDLLVLANDSSEQTILAGAAIAQGVSVLTTADRPDAVSALLRLDALAKDRGVCLVAGAAYSPGMSCILASYLASQMDKVTEIHIARIGTGGPACARNHHRSLSAMSIEYYEGNLKRGPGGSGRELYWFPEPLGGADCYAGAMPEPILLSRTFDQARRITSKRAARRRDRFTSAFPMLSPPHTEGGLGGIRVDVRGIVSGRFTELTAASVALPAMAAASVLTMLIAAFKKQTTSAPVFSPGVMSLSELPEPKKFLAELAQCGISISVFHGSENYEPAQNA